MPSEPALFMKVRREMAEWRAHKREDRLVSLVYLVYLVCLVEPDRPDEPDQPSPVSLESGIRTCSRSFMKNMG